MKFIIGKKLNMTQVWHGDAAIAVSPVQVGPCVVTQVKNSKKDGYEAVQIGYGTKKAKRVKKPQAGHLKDLGNLRKLKEFRVKDEVLKRGDIIDISTFISGDMVDVTGTSKGKGFQGVVKRHGFHGHPKTHGTKDAVRMPGSIGATGPAHVFKGMRMAGHMGDVQITTKNLEIVQVDEANNVLYIKGSVPGATNGVVVIKGKGELKIKADGKEAVIETPVTEIAEVVSTKPDENIEKVVIEAHEKQQEKESEKIADKNK
jgi:large subunit ribosomal protein L3